MRQSDEYEPHTMARMVVCGSILMLFEIRGSSSPLTTSKGRAAGFAYAGGQNQAAAVIHVQANIHRPASRSACCLTLQA